MALMPVRSRTDQIVSGDDPFQVLHVDVVVIEDGAVHRDLGLIPELPRRQGVIILAFAVMEQGICQGMVHQDAARDAGGRAVLLVLEVRDQPDGQVRDPLFHGGGGVELIPDPADMVRDEVDQDRWPALGRPPRVIALDHFLGNELLDRPALTHVHDRPNQLDPRGHGDIRLHDLVRLGLSGGGMRPWVVQLASLIRRDPDNRVEPLAEARPERQVGKGTSGDGAGCGRMEPRRPGQERGALDGMHQDPFFGSLSLIKQEPIAHVDAGDTRWGYHLELVDHGDGRLQGGIYGVIVGPGSIVTLDDIRIGHKVDRTGTVGRGDPELSPHHEAGPGAEVLNFSEMEIDSTFYELDRDIGVP